MIGIARPALVAALLALTLLVALVPTPVARAETAGDLFVVDIFANGGNGAIFRVNPTTGAKTVVYTEQSIGRGGLTRVVLAADGKLYAVEQSGHVLRIDPSQPNGANHAVISVGQFFNVPVDIVAAGNGVLFVLDISSLVIRIDPTLPDNANQILVSSDDFMSLPTAMTMGPDGKLYVTDLSSGVIRVDPGQPDGVNQTLVSDIGLMDTPAGIVATLDGKLYVADSGCSCTQDGGIFRIDPTQPVSSNQTLISAGNFLTDALGIVLAADGTLLVADGGCCAGGLGGIIRVSPATPSPVGANQTLLASGAPFDEPIGLALVPSVAIADTGVTEGTGGQTPATFTVTLAPWSPQQIAVPFVAASGTATSGNDFLPTTSTVVFAPAEVMKTGAVQVIGDALAESTETFAVTLQGPAGVGLTRATATVAITDDEATPTLAIADVIVTEANTDLVATLQVTLTPASAQVVTVQFATGDSVVSGVGAATLGSDFRAASGQLTFAPGQTTATVQVPILADTVAEGAESLGVTLSIPTGGAVIGRATGLVSILDDDAVQACSPRPRVATGPSVTGGSLRVVVESTPMNTQQNNPIRRLRFGEIRNAQVTLGGQPVLGNQDIAIPAGTVAAEFTVKRVAANQPAMVFFTVVDSCGDFPTFVGGGTGAGF